MSDVPFPSIQPSADPSATAFAIAYAIWTQLPAEKRGAEPKEMARTVGELADVIIKRGVVSIRRT